MNKLKRVIKKARYFPVAISLILILSGMDFFPTIGEGREEGKEYQVEFESRTKQLYEDKLKVFDFIAEENKDHSEITETEERIEYEETSVNIPPVADTGPDQIAYLVYYPVIMVKVYFDSSNSYDLDGIIVDFSWDFGDGFTGSGESTSHTYYSPGIYTVTLLVTDDEGATGFDTANITVLEAEIGNITTDKYFYEIGEPVNITYTGVHGSPMSYTPPSPGELHFIIKNEFYETVVEEPLYGEITLPVVWQWRGTVNWTWNQECRIYGGNRTPDDLIPPTGDRVPPGKYYVWFDTHYIWGLVGPAEFEIIAPSEEPLKITTDKYTYYQGEPVHITITGYRVGPSSDFDRGYIIKDEFGNWVRDPPQVFTTDIFYSWGPDNHTWYQKYELLYDYDIDGNQQIHYPNNGEQVSLGKYYIYPEPGNCEPAEIEIIARPKIIIEKEKISGPDEVLTHTYNEWELRIVISGASPNKSYENVVVYDVLPAELKLIEYELTQGTLDITKKGKGKMGATHLTWFVGNLSGDAELIIKIATRENPAGKQEFTSPGEYLLNDGAWVEGIDYATGETIKEGPTDPIFVTALENPNYNNKKSHR